MRPDFVFFLQIHFESSQFEQNRQDGLRKLKSNAIPTLFDVPNPPKMIGNMKRKRFSIILSFKFLHYFLSFTSRVPI